MITESAHCSKDFPIDPNKYIVIKTDAFKEEVNFPVSAQELADLILKYPDAVICQKPESENEFFVLMLKDLNARDALIGYARAACARGQRILGSAVQCLAERAGFLSKFKKTPD